MDDDSIIMKGGTQDDISRAAASNGADLTRDDFEPHKFTQKDFLSRLEELYRGNVEISRRKNSDYATADDPFANFKACEIYGVSAEAGLIVRMSDKMMRTANLVIGHKIAAVEDEKVADTLSDLANYAMILRILIEERTKERTVKALGADFSSHNHPPGPFGL